MRFTRLSSGASLLLALAVTPEARAQDVQDLLGPNHALAPQADTLTQSHPVFRGRGAADRLRFWNQIAVDTSGLDHTPVQPGEDRTFGHQLGPGRSSRAMAIVHIAIFDAVNSIRGGYRSYSNVPRAAIGASVDAAIAQAAHDALIASYPSHAVRLDQLLDEDLDRIVASFQAKQRGIAAGQRAADAILTKRIGDHSEHADPLMGSEYLPDPDPGIWRQDPISHSPIALGAHWGEVTPFVLEAPEQFRVPAPPPMDSVAYKTAYNEVKRLGGDGVTTPTQRTDEQTHIGIYWAYDGTPSLCAPPRLYNQITTKVSQRITDVGTLARLYALVNVAMADAGVAVWESKFHYNFWRPVTGIRESDPGTGPTGLGDGNPGTIGDLTYSPLGAPASNLTGPNFTPPFPSYPSGHAGFGGALFQTLRNFFGTDRVAFTFTSDEFNGATVGNDGQVRPLEPRSFRSFSQAEEENGQSRIYLGIHWSFDKTQGIAQGRQVANYVYRHAFLPAR